MADMLKIIARSLFAVFIIFLNTNPASGDDAGITKVRLIQLSDSSYVFEADVPQALLWTIRSPIFPERFTFSDFDFENQSGWITLSLSCTTEGDPLSPEDEIILPWSRFGVDITVQWEDGLTYRGFYTRSLNGIHIPLSGLMPVNEIPGKVFLENYSNGIRHLTFWAVHILLIVSLVWIVPFVRVLKILLWFTFGQALALILFDLGVQGFDRVMGELIMLLIVFIISYSAAYRINIKYLGLLLLIAGLIHGLSYARELSISELTPLLKTQALFAFNFAIDSGHYLLALLLLLLIPPVQDRLKSKNWVPIVTGSVSVFLILLMFNDVVRSGRNQIPGGIKSTVINESAIAGRSGYRAGRVPTGKGKMTTPIVVYLSVEPFETRQEILIQARSAVEILGLELPGQISTDLQAELKEDLMDSVISNSVVYINGKQASLNEIRADFVALSRGGVSTKTIPVEENLDDGIIGLTLFYETESFPDSIRIDWKLFPESVQTIEASAVDPHGALTIFLSSEENQFRWRSSLSGYKVPVLEAVKLSRPPVPLISILLWTGMFLYIFYLLGVKKMMLRKYWIIIIIGVGFVFYPYVRFNIDLPVLTQGKPTKDRATIILNDLLENVYLSFDRRSEELVYDRLAMTVTGDQLTDIYLQNRKSMEMENRGGLRAKVDEIQIQELYEVDRSDIGGYVADVRWTIRGSVNHFGHTHYRKNQYRARVSFVSDNETWKINHIESIDETRLY
jgi:hypothetical protein